MVPEPAIGDLRWRVRLLRRDQEPAEDAAGIEETPVLLASTWAKIEPVGALTFFGSTQVETPVTHRITIRWRHGLDTTHAIERTSKGADGVERTETFRVRRQMEPNGRKRWMVFEVELERQA